MKKFEEILENFRTWRLSHLDEKKILILLSFIVGLVSGFAAVLLKNLIHLLGRFLTRDFTT
jgi:CIC family chloride channel protein